MARAKLTALVVERAHRSGESVLLSDGDGLYLRKQTRDGASWTLRYHFAGRQHWLTLGNYPDMPLAQARVEARQARVLLDKQQDPLTVRRAALAEERQKGSFKSLCEDWYRAEVQARGLKHPAVPRRYLDKYLLPKLGRLPACDISPADVARMLDEIVERQECLASYSAVRIRPNRRQVRSRTELVFQGRYRRGGGRSDDHLSADGRVGVWRAVDQEAPQGCRNGSDCAVNRHRQLRCNQALNGGVRFEL
jgi:hypothetical protein